MVRVAVGQDHGVQGGPAVGLHGLGHRVPGPLRAAEAAAVHQDGAVSGVEQGRRALAHVHHHRREGVVSHRQPGQGPCRLQARQGQQGGQHISPPPDPAQQTHAQQSIDQHQPHGRRRGAEPEAVAGDPAQQLRRPQHVPGQRRRQNGQRRGGRQDGAQGRNGQGQGEEDRGHPQHQEVCQGRDQGQGAEIGRAQGRGEHGHPGAGGQGGPDKGRSGLHGPVDPGREGQQARHGGKGELKAHRRDGKGIDQQNHQSGGGQGGGCVRLPSHQRSQQGQAHHHAGPDHRGGGPGHEHVRQQHRISHQGGEPLAAEGEHAQQGDEKAAVEAGHGGQVHEPRLRELPLAPAVQAVPLPGEHSQEETPLRLIVDGSGGAFQRPGHPLGQIASAGLRLHFAPAVQAQKHAPGGEVGALLSAQLAGAVIFHAGGHPVSRLQVQQLPAAVVHGPARHALDAHLTARAEVRLLRIAGQLHDRPALCTRQRPGRGLDQGSIAGEPDQPRRQTGGANAHPHRQKSGRQSGQQGDQGRPQPPGLRQEIVAQGAPGPEGQGKHHQLPHGRYLMGSMRSVRPRI